jgi:cytochrome c-type biogenesis protein CcmE
MAHRACGTVATPMDRDRKRRTRLVVATSAAVVLAGALVYTSFSAASDAKDPSQLAASAVAGRSYQLTGKVVPGYRREGNALLFRVRDRNGTASVPVRYTGAVPDPFRAGREVIVTVRKQGAVFAGEKDSLVTKCPSKFTADPSGRAT